MSTPQHTSKRRRGELILTVPLFLALSSALFCGNAERLHARLLMLGESLFTGYFQLQSDPKSPPDCDTLFQSKAVAPSGEDEEMEGLFGEGEEAPSDPSEEEDLEGIFGEDGDHQSAAAAQAEARARAINQCKEEHVTYAEITARITTGVKIFRTFERGVSGFIAWVVEHFKHFLVLIMLLGTLIASVRDEHISLRPALSPTAHCLRELTQLITFAFLLASSWSYRALLSLPEELTLNLLWLGGLLLLVVLHGYRLILSANLPRSEEQDHSLSAALLSIPLFSVMGIISGLYFVVTGHHSGLAIELTKLTEHAMLYVNVALYVWVGMLLKQSSITKLVFNLLRPMKLEPALLAAVVVVGAAIPTAYSGASGIFVIAAGALIYDELRAAGAKRQLSLAATAMSGSLGVVLSPCLLVVIIASLNKQVTTDELFGWGVWVFVLSAVLFTLVALSQRDRDVPLVGASRAEAVPEIQAALRALIWPVITIVTVLIAYWLILDTFVDEHSAPMILPVLLIMMLWREMRRPAQAEEGKNLKTTLGAATDEAGPHIGALLSLMGFSICLGGVLERAHVMSLFPESFSSIWIAMMAFVFILVLIGMSMDPYGAVILVSATIAEVAYQSGINPVHFWMVVLVAFELGYLSPPVALNHLLTRQVVGETELSAANVEVSGGSFMKRQERIVLPLIVMGTALIIVAFGPLFFY